MEGRNGLQVTGSAARLVRLHDLCALLDSPRLGVVNHRVSRGQFRVHFRPQRIRKVSTPNMLSEANRSISIH